MAAIYGSMSDSVIYDNKFGRLKIAIIFLVIANVGGVARMFLPSNIIEVATFLLCVPLLINGYAQFSKKLLSIIIVVWLVILLSAIATQTSVLEYKGLYLRTFLAYVIISVFRNNFSDISNAIYKVGKFICVLGAINFLLATFFPSIFVLSATSDGSYEVNTIFYVFNWKSELLFFKRNQCLFWEPGIFQIILNLHLFLILFERNEPIRKAIFPIALVLTTGSTTGYFIMFCLLAIKMIYKPNENRKSSRNSLFGRIFILILLFSSFPLLRMNVENKFEGAASKSAAMRTFDLLSGIQTIKNNPIFGIGFNAERYRNQTYDVDITQYYDNAGSFDLDRGNTNTIIYIFCAFGIPLALLFLFYLYKQCIYKKRALFIAIFLICLFSEPLFNNTLMMLLFLSGLYSQHIDKFHTSSIKNR